MKYILIIFLAAAFFVTGSAQNTQAGFSIKGTFGNSRQADSIFIYGEDDIIAGAPVVNGAFTLTGSIAEPRQVTLITRVKGEGPDEGGKAGRLILENANYSFERGKLDIKIKGGELHNLVLGFESSDEYQQAVDDYAKTMDAIYADKSDDDFYEPTPEEEKQISEKMKKALAIEDRNLTSVIENPKSPALAKAFAVGRIQNWDAYPMEKRLAIFDACKKELGGSSSTIDELRGIFEKAKEAEEMEKTVSQGNPFKDIEAKDVNGKVVKLSDVVAKNKFTILEFWASWCGPCRGEIPNLKKAYEKYKSKGLEIYSVSIDEDSAKWLKALEEENATWLNVIDDLGNDGVAAKSYGVSGVPASFLIDKDGKILVSNEKLRGKDLDRTLSEYMP